MLITYLPTAPADAVAEKVVEPVSWSAVAIAALKILAAEVGKKIGQEIGKAIAKALGRLFGIEGRGIDPMELQRMLDQMADRIIQQISIKIDRNEIRKLNAEVMALATTFEIIVKAPQTNREEIRSLLRPIRSTLYQLSSMCSGTENVPPMRAATLPAAIICGTILILCHAKWYQIALDSNAEDIDGVKDGLKRDIEICLNIIEDMVVSVRDDFEAHVRGPNVTEHLLRCLIQRDGDGAGGRDYFSQRSVPALEAYLYGVRIVAVSSTCTSNTDSRPELVARCQQIRNDLAASFKNSYETPLEELRLQAKNSEKN